MAPSTARRSRISNVELTNFPTMTSRILDAVCITGLEGETRGAGG